MSVDEIAKQAFTTWPYGSHVEVTSDGFEGTIVGWYITREGRLGLALQQHGTRMVHVYHAERCYLRSPP